MARANTICNTAREIGAARNISRERILSQVMTSQTTPLGR
jgi:hypothetical protein